MNVIKKRRQGDCSKIKAHFGKAVDEVRAQEAKTLKEKGYECSIIT